MIKSNGSLTEAKEIIKNLQSKRVDVTVDLGRNKFLNFTGKLTGVYSALFTVSPDSRDFKCKTSYSYQEYLCGKVKLTENNA